MTDQVAQGQDLDNYLVNLADGLSRAQSKLNNHPVVNAFGQEAMVYHIPKMEFELQLEMTTQTEKSTSDGLPIFKKLAFTPTTSTPDKSSSSATSIIKGVMVATPIDASKPQIRLNLTAVKQPSGEVVITVTGKTSTGEPLSQANAELNIDRELSNELNKHEARPKLKTGTKLHRSSVVLSATGQAESQLVIATNEPSGQIIAITADLFSKTETLLYRHK